MRPERLLRCAASALLATALLAGLPAQHEEHPTPPAAAKAGAPARPTHAPNPELPPLLAWQHVREGNEAFVRAVAERTAAPEPAPRPSGAGRYVCAVIVCADARVDVPQLLGLLPRDVLLLSAPGPFVHGDAVALLEQAVAEERLSLVVVLGHADCRTLATEKGTSERQDALAERVDAVRREAARTGVSLPQCLLRRQCAQVLAASDVLREREAEGSLRVMPAEVDPRSGRLTWLHAPIDEFALPPVVR